MCLKSMEEKIVKLKISESIYKTVLSETVFYNLGFSSSFDFCKLKYSITDITNESVKLSISNNTEFFNDNYESPVKEIIIKKGDSATISNSVKPTTSFEITILDIIDGSPKVFI